MDSNLFARSIYPTATPCAKVRTNPAVYRRFLRVPSLQPLRQPAPRFAPPRLKSVRVFVYSPVGEAAPRSRLPVLRRWGQPRGDDAPVAEVPDPDAAADLLLAAAPELDPALVLPGSGVPISEAVSVQPTMSMTPLENYTERLRKEVHHERKQ